MESGVFVSRFDDVNPLDSVMRQHCNRVLAGEGSHYHKAGTAAIQGSQSAAVEEIALSQET